jgi:hypothetical protein
MLKHSLAHSTQSVKSSGQQIDLCSRRERRTGIRMLAQRVERTGSND